MDLYEKIDEFFTHYKRAIPLSKLCAMLKITKKEQEILKNVLYQLQLTGKVYLDEYGNYLHVPSDCCLKSGMVNISNKGNYYVKVGKSNIHLKNGKKLGVQKGDYVFVEVLLSTKKKHDQYQEGIIKRIVKSPTLDETESYLEKGIVHVSKNQTYYLETDKEQIKIEKNELGSAYANDLVTAEIKNVGREKRAIVKQVLKRNETIHLYKYETFQGILEWISVENGYYPTKLLTKEEFHEHDCIFAKIVAEKDGVVHLEAVQKIDDRKKTQTVAEAIVKNYGFPSQFKEEALKEAEELSKNNFLGNRTDYTKLVTVTIDGETAKDFDDAISIERLVNGNYMLYVHIADVTHYVKLGTVLQQEAYERGTSVYLGDKVFPMFPKILSDDLCSLNPNQLKATKTCRMEIDNTGKVIDFFITDSLIRSNKRMTYQAVDDLLERGIALDGYEKFLKELMWMKELSAILQKRKLKRGYTSFCSDKNLFQLDDFGYPKKIQLETSSISRQIIENFMLAANETVASYLYFLDVPTLYRNHESPKSYQLKEMVKILKETGYWNEQIDIKDPFFLPKLLKRYQHKKEFLYLSRIIMKSLTKAYYDPKCYGHYGLGLLYYTHFTSPIRRYPDFRVHEALNRVWNNEAYSPEEQEDLKGQGIHLSDREVAANNAEATYQQYLLGLYTDQFKKKELRAEIVFLDKENIYVRTIENIEGILYHSGRYDKIKKQVSYNQKEYHIGDQISVVLQEKTNEEGQYIFDFYKPKEKKLIKKKHNN